MQHATKLSCRKSRSLPSTVASIVSLYNAKEPLSMLLRRLKPKPPCCTCDGNGTEDTRNAGNDAVRRTSEQSNCCGCFRAGTRAGPAQQQSTAGLQSADMAVGRSSATDVR